MITGVFDLFLLALFAAVVYRLISVLGRRTGNERPPFSYRDPDGDGAQSSESDSNVISLPGSRARDQQAQATSMKVAVDKVAPEGSPLANALLDIQMADRSFEPDQFLSGARGAYEMIVSAFAAGDRRALRPLLSGDVYNSFDTAIGDRETRGNTIESSFVGIEKAEIVGASLKQRISEITVKFVSEIISVTKNADGAVIEGDPTSVKKITDIWTFARDIGSANPNWKLIGTASGT